MQIKHLTSFVTVAKTRNMAQTALALNYSHSTIYSHLESLEKEFGVKLYYRTSHGIELTPQGESLLSFAQKFLRLYEETHAALSETKQTTLRIGASESSDVCLMHDLIREFIGQAPPIEIEYSKMTVDIALLKLVAGTCDISISCEFNFNPDSVYCQYLCTLKLVFVTGTPPAQQKDSEHLPKLLGTMKPAVAQGMMQSVGLNFNDYFSSLTNIGDVITIKQLLHYGPGVAILPKVYVEQDINNGLLYRIPDMMQEIELDTFVLTSSKSHIGQYTQELIDLAFSLYNPNHLSHCVFPPER